MEKRRFFQYLAGERKGEVVEFDRIEEDDDMIFVKFKDGSRCNEELILPLNDKNWSNQLMAEISDPKNKWRFEEKWIGRQEEKWAENADGEKVCVKPFIKGRKKITPIPPKPVKAKFGKIDTSYTDKREEKREEKKEEKHQLHNDPVWVMMEKAKKFSTEVSMTLTISLPSKSLYDVAKESFDEGGTKVIEYIINNIDDKLLKDSLRTALTNAYEDEIDVKNKEDVQTNDDSKKDNYEVVEEPKIGDPQVASEEEVQEYINKNNNESGG